MLNQEFSFDIENSFTGFITFFVWKLGGCLIEWQEVYYNRFVIWDR